MVYIKHTGIYVKQLERMASFYKNVFDMYVICENCNDSGYMYEQLYNQQGAKVTITKLVTEYGKNTKKGDMLELIYYQYSPKVQKQDNTNIFGCGVMHISFGVDDINKIVQRVIENGGKIETDIITRGERKVCFVVDPEGNWIELIQ